VTLSLQIILESNPAPSENRRYFSSDAMRSWGERKGKERGRSLGGSAFENAF